MALMVEFFYIPSDRNTKSQFVCLTVKSAPRVAVFVEFQISHKKFMLIFLMRASKTKSAAIISVAGITRVKALTADGLFCRMLTDDLLSVIRTALVNLKKYSLMYR